MDNYRQKVDAIFDEIENKVDNIIDTAKTMEKELTEDNNCFENMTDWISAFIEDLESFKLQLR